MADARREPPCAQEHRGAPCTQVQEVDEMNVTWDVQERTCAICGRVFIPKAPHAKYCSGAVHDEIMAMRREVAMRY